MEVFPDGTAQAAPLLGKGAVAPAKPEAGGCRAQGIPGRIVRTETVAARIARRYAAA